MSNKTYTNAISFWDYLNNNTIEIPIIQRDYAHGRLGKENLRKNFLADLKKALDDESPYKGISMKLDFVYGSTENGKMNPLDGQQRLTTLWLLHWYIALRAEELNEDNCAVFRKFTYETRISSREFCENLCVPEHFINYPGNDIVRYITKQTWFYSAWKQDPTIQSMLRMLGGTKTSDKRGEDIVDGIEELFQNTDEKVFKNYWLRLTTKETIVFYHLPLSDFGLSDDLYIKMNARGKQLTGFENFKADLIGYISKQSEDESLEESIREKWKELLDPKDGIPIKFDTDWTDIFWKNKSLDNRIDEIYFAFLNRFFWNELFIAKKSGSPDSYILDIGKGDESSTQENNNPSYKYLNNSDHPNDFDTTVAYEGLDIYKFNGGSIPLSLFQKLTKVLNGYLNYPESNTLPRCSWDTNFEFIPRYEKENSNNIEISNNANEKILKVTPLNQVQRVVYFALCKFFSDSDVISTDEASIKQWMRVVWNLVSGDDINGRPQIRSTQAMRTAMRFISELNSHDVYNSLISYDIQKLGYSDFDERCKEEITKAKQILDENGTLRKYNGICRKPDGSKYQTWEDIIIKAEEYGIFKGAIRFLFTDGEGSIKWGDFDEKWKNVQGHIDEEGQLRSPNFKLLKTLICHFDKWDHFKAIYYDNKLYHWKSNLLNNKLQNSVHLLLRDNTPIDFSSYQPIINEEGKKDVQNQLVKTNLLESISKEDYYMEDGPNLHRYYKNRDTDIYFWHPHKNELMKNSCFTFTRKIAENCHFFYGKNINFEYNDHYFQWWGTPNEKELDVYIMEKDWKDYKKRKDPPIEGQPDNINYYCFKVTKDMESDISLFTNQLDSLITQAFPEESD